MSAFQHVEITYDSPGRWPGFSFGKRNGPSAGHAPGPQARRCQSRPKRPRRWAGRRAGAVPIRAQIRAQNLHSGKKWQMGRLTVSYPGLWCGTSFDIYPMKFDCRSRTISTSSRHQQRADDGHASVERVTITPRRIPVLVKATTNRHDFQRTDLLAPLLDQVNCVGKPAD